MLHAGPSLRRLCWTPRGVSLGRAVFVAAVAGGAACGRAGSPALDAAGPSPTVANGGTAGTPPPVSVSAPDAGRVVPPTSSQVANAVDGGMAAPTPGGPFLGAPGSFAPLVHRLRGSVV